jgi:S-adenosylmethionine:tRNA-ribosyltransferase-isomerase (queuine synthetase)
MNLDKTALKRLIDQTRQGDLLVLDLSRLEKNSLQMCQKEIEKFIKKQEDYLIMVIKR